jgi:hypothetical protein
VVVLHDLVLHVGHHQLRLSRAVRA